VARGKLQPLLGTNFILYPGLRPDLKLLVLGSAKDYAIL